MLHVNIVFQYFIQYSPYFLNDCTNTLKTWYFARSLPERTRTSGRISAIILHVFHYQLVDMMALQNHIKLSVISMCFWTQNPSWRSISNNHNWQLIKLTITSSWTLTPLQDCIQKKLVSHTMHAIIFLLEVLGNKSESSFLPYFYQLSRHPGSRHHLFKLYFTMLELSSSDVTHRTTLSDFYSGTKDLLVL